MLDLDETLVHFDEDTDYLAIRPYATEFLEEMANYYEIVIFTAGMKDYADWAISMIGDGES